MLSPCPIHNGLGEPIQSIFCRFYVYAPQPGSTGLRGFRTNRRDGNPPLAAVTILSLTPVLNNWQVCPTVFELAKVMTSTWRFLQGRDRDFVRYEWTSGLVGRHF